MSGNIASSVQKAWNLHHLQIFRGNGCFTRSWYVQGVWVWLEEVKTIAVRGVAILRQQYRISPKPRPNLQSSSYLATTPPPIHSHLHLPLPPPFTLAPCQLPSASPLWCSERNFTAAVSLLFAHAHAHSKTHACVRAPAHTKAQRTHAYVNHARELAHTKTHMCLPQVFALVHTHACCLDDSFPDI